VDFKKILPHLISAVLLLAVSMAFFAPNAFNGKVLSQSDNDKAAGMQTEIMKYYKTEGSTPLWTNSAFGGMPSYQIYTRPETDLIRPAAKAPFLFQGISSVWSQVFAAMLLMYLFLTVLKLDWRVALVGALGYGITSYNVDILEAGHTTKMMALAFLPGMFAAVVLITRGSYLLGGGMLALLTAMQLYVNHVQITYYALLLMGIYFLVDLIYSVKEKNMVNWTKGAAVAGFSLLLGFSTSASRMLSTWEYGKETIRGSSELSEKASKGDGLDKDYLFGWSYGVGESMTLLVPHFEGGGANETFKDSKLYRALPPESRRGISSVFYMGDQPFVGTAIYFGAIICFLAFLGAFLVNDRIKWWLLTGGVFALSLAWGKNFFLNHIFYDYLPMFNKFRAVSMALGVSQLCFAALAAVGLQGFLSDKYTADKKKKTLFIAAGITIGLCAFAMAFAGDSGPNDEKIFAQQPQLLKMLAEDRAALVSSDALRSIGFIALSALLLFLYLRGTLKAALVALAIAALALIDHWGVCARTISADKYTTAKSATAAPKPEAFDTEILKDKDIHYRVLDLARGSITGNGVNSFFHKSINGYHAAKLQRFQEVVDMYLDGDKLNKSLHILGMMNTKYIISPDGKVIPNPMAYGHAWFVKNYQIVKDGNAELAGLGDLNPRDTALVQASFASALEGLNITSDSTAKIDLVAYHPEKMQYEYSAATEQLAVFPEQYYPASKGWKCYLNGQPYNDIIKANYMLRALRVPAGQNMKLEMRFEPSSWRIGSTLSLVGSLLTFLLIGVGLFFKFKSGTSSSTDPLVDTVVEAPSAAVVTPKKK
jgi:hypothetical protein